MRKEKSLKGVGGGGEGKGKPRRPRNGTGVLHVLAVSFKGLNQLGYFPCGIIFNVYILRHKIF